MRKNPTTTLKIACEYGYDYDRVICKNINLTVNPQAADDDLLLAAKTIAGLQTLPLHGIERLDMCDLAE